MKLLIVDDSMNLSVIDRFLPGSEIKFAHDFEELKARLVSEDFDCVVADVSSLDDISVQLIKNIKGLRRSVGLILISEQDDLQRRIEALTAGADDYLTSPFDISELAARIISLSRRVNSFKQEDLIFNEIRIDMDAKMVYVNDSEIDLTKKEFELLLYLIERKNNIIKKESLVSFLSGQINDFKSATDIVYAHVKNLKKKLGAAGCKAYLKTIYGIGYKWEVR